MAKDKSDVDGDKEKTREIIKAIIAGVVDGLGPIRGAHYVEIKEPSNGDTVTKPSFDVECKASADVVSIEVTILRYNKHKNQWEHLKSLAAAPPGGGVKYWKATFSGLSGTPDKLMDLLLAVGTTNSGASVGAAPIYIRLPT